METKKRVLWVDIAKAISIISVIISHTVPNPSHVRSLLFSFHMPLFFILSGYTTKLAQTKADFFRRLKKNFLHVLLPVIILLPIGIIVRCAIAGDFSQYFEYFKTWLGFSDGLYFGAGAMLWFVWALFFAKTFMDLIKVALKTERSELLFILLGLLGIFLGATGHRLPLNIDLILAAIGFIEVGIFWRRNEKTISKYHYPILLGSLALWFNLLLNGQYAEIYIRSYPGGIISIIESLAATYVVCEISKIIEDCANNERGILKKITNWIVTIGKNTMYIYLFHTFDQTLFSWLWNRQDGSRKTMILSIAIRLALNLIAFVLIYLILKKLHSRQKRKI